MENEQNNEDMKFESMLKMSGKNQSISLLPITNHAREGPIIPYLYILLQ